MSGVAVTGRSPTRALVATVLRVAYRRNGGPLGILGAALAVAATDEIARRALGGTAPDAWGGPDAGPIVLAALAVGIVAVLGLASGRWARPRSGGDVAIDVQPIRGRALAAVAWVELALALVLPALLAGVALRRATPIGLAPIALVPLAMVPAIAGLALVTAVSAARGAAASVALAGILGAVAWAPDRVATHVHGWPMVAALAAASAVAAGLAVRVAGPRVRQSRAAARTPRRSERGAALPMARLLRLMFPVPRVVRALLAADVALILRGTHRRGQVLIPLLWCVPLAYLVWPIPLRVAGAPLLVAGMLSAFGLASIGYVLGADLGVAERPYLALRRTAPIRGAAVWWSRLLLASGAGLVFAAVFAVAILVRHGWDEAGMIVPIAMLGIVVPTYAVGTALAADAGGDSATAGAIAMSTAFVAALALVAWVAFPPLVALYPLAMRGPYARARARWRKVEVV